jgi:dTDP-glucose pyrophosphorylase
VPLQFSTRGAAESALVASHYIKNRDLPLVFLDGDNIHTNNVTSSLREFYYPTSGKRVRHFI